MGDVAGGLGLRAALARDGDGGAHAAISAAVAASAVSVAAASASIAAAALTAATTYESPKLAACATAV